MTTDPDTTAQSPCPQAIGPYSILEVLGEGGMGTVYLAEQTEPLRRLVAVKVIKPGMDTRQVLARFDVERQALSLMSHSCIARVFDAGTTDAGRPYFVMEYVAGRSIVAYCDEQRLTIEERLRLFLDVCAGVHHAHQKGVIHRDLKPSNVLVTTEVGKAVPKIIDFGLATATEQKLTEQSLYTEEGQWIGTPEYMSPEQAGLSGHPVDTRSDIYALGVLLYELISGQLPFDPRELRAAGILEIQRRIQEEEPRKPSTRVPTSGVGHDRAASARRMEPQALRRHLRGDLDWVTMKALEKDPSRRYDSAAALASDIERHLSFEPVLAGPPSASYRMRKFLRKNRGPVAAVAAVIVSLAIGLFVALTQYLELRDTEAEVRRLAEEERAARAEADAAREQSERVLVEGLSGVDTRLLAALEREASGRRLEKFAPAEIRAWLVEANELGARLPLYESALVSVRTMGRRDGEGWAFADAAVQRFHDQLSALVDALRLFARDPKGTMQRVLRLPFVRAELDRANATMRGR